MSEDIMGFNSSLSQAINQEDQQNYDESKEGQTPPKRQIGIFEQFKIKYDQVRKDCQTKRKQIQQLNRVNKRLEIQILNINTEFYDKQIKRLNTEVEKLQETNEDYKDKYLQAENKRKQLSATVNVKQEEMKKCIKNLEQEKIQNVELKHQMKQKQRALLTIIKSVQDAGNQFSQKYSSSEKKLNQTENELKTKERQLEAMKKLNDKLQKLIKQTEEDHKKVIEKHQIQIKGVKSSSQQLQDHGRKYRAEIGELKQKINQLNIQVQKRSTMINLQSVRKLQAVTQYKSTQILQLTNKKIEQQNEQLKKQLSQKQKAFHILSNQLQTLSDERNQIEKTHEEKLKTLENKKNLIEKHYEGLNLGLKKELEIMKIKHSKVEDNHQQFQSLKSNNLSMKNLNSFKSNLSHNSQLSVLDSELSLALESKTLELSNLRKILGDKVEEIYLLQQKLQDVSIRENSLFTEIDFLKKKLSACEKNSKMTNEIELSTLKGELESVQRKKETLQSKLATKIKEVKLKDEFIANSIIGKIKSQQDSSLVLAEIQRIFENDYLIKLRQADDKVKQLECKLQIKG